ncbi:MAG: hypothetical protein GDA56_21435 [Hormoscilla sp. GM7CHS1pb]|nr:hypothetical protein [Hormoscilla sp. GM7CHS1pb]
MMIYTKSERLPWPLACLASSSQVTKTYALINRYTIPVNGSGERCPDAFDFHAEVKLICSVRQPALIVQRQITDVRQLLEPLIIDVMRRTSRNYKVEESGAAECAISRKVEEEVSDVGFKLNRFTLTLSLEEEARERIRKKKTIQEEAELKKTAIQVSIEVGALEQKEKMQREKFEMELKQQRMKFYGPIRESQNWQLLASLLTDSPQDIAVIMETIKQQQLIDRNDKMRTLQMLLEADALEGTQVVDVARNLLQELTGLPEQSRAELESGSTKNTELIAGETEDDPEDTSSIPEEFARDEDEEDE